MNEIIWLPDRELKSVRWLSPTSKRFYRKLREAKRTLKKAKPLAIYRYEFQLLADKLDSLIWEIEEKETFPEEPTEEMLKRALQRKGLTPIEELK